MQRPSGSRRLFATALVFAAAAAACSGTESSGSTQLRVVTAFYPIELAAQRAGGALVDVANLTPPGAEPHDLELRPSDVRLIRSADLILYFANGFQPTIENAIAALRDRSKALDLLAGLPLKPPGSSAEEGLTADPHVWLSPPLMQRIVDTVANTLAERLPSNAAEIRARAGSLDQDLAILDAEFRARLASCARREIFTSHAAFDYLADRYGLRQVAITGLSPQAEPSSKRLQEVARLARESGATTIFFETLVSPRVAQAVARIVGAKTAVLDPIEGLTRDEAAAGADYFSVMRSNLENLGEALDCRS